jgi:hypothetical protein
VKVGVNSQLVGLPDLPEVTKRRFQRESRALPDCKLDGVPCLSQLPQTPTST